MLHANTFLIHDLCTFKKWHLLVRIIVVIIQNIGPSRLLPTLLDQNCFVKGIIRKHLLLHNQVLANKDFVNLKSYSWWHQYPVACEQISCRLDLFFLWGLWRHPQSKWQSKWLSVSLHLQMNNEYLKILHSNIFYQNITVWHLLTVFGVTVWHLHKLWHGNGTF